MARLEEPKKKWKTLYKQSNTGALMQWKIWTVSNRIYTEFGQVGGKLQKTKDVVKEWKNLGRSNRKNPVEQAQFEAKSKFIKQKRKGYVVDKEAAAQKKVDTKVVEGGLFPMLAQDFNKAVKHLKFPCAVQPKLDGIRMIYVDQALWSRTRLKITRLPHIMEALEAMDIHNLKLDGEGYNHKYKEDFEEIASKVTAKNAVAEGFEMIEYHVYDIPELGKTFQERYEILEELFRYMPERSPVKLVPTIIVNNPEELKAATEKFLDAGYEGAMARNLEGKYELNKRSKHLQKIKNFQDGEFKIVGIEEGRGKLDGHVGAFVMEIDDEHGKRTFKAKMKGNVKVLKQCFEDHSMWKGKMMTVQYMGFTNANHKPRHPIAKTIRDMRY